MRDTEEGDDCPECDGRMHYPPVENCACYISPPCYACVENRLECDKCGCPAPSDEETDDDAHQIESDPSA